MNWLRFLMSDETKEPPTLTPETAETILDIMGEALQQDDGLPYHPRSSLKGYDVFQVDTALKLRTANDLLLLTTMGREAELDDRVKQVESVALHVYTLFVDDAERNKLLTVPRGSREYTSLNMKMSPAPSAIKDPKLGKLELLSSFAKYCRHVGAKDPLYWQKIYTRLDLPYSKACPRGNDPVWPEGD